MPPKSVTISISTEAFDEFQVAMKAAELDTMPDQLVIKRDINIKQPIDFRLATVRMNCLTEAVKCGQHKEDNIIEIAQEMYDFVTGKEVEPTSSESAIGHALIKQHGKGGWK